VSLKWRTRSEAVLAIGALLTVAGACGRSTESVVRTPADAPAQAATTTALPNEQCVFCPGRGAVLTVVGIAFDDELSLRVGPDDDQDVVATLPPVSDVVATGNNQPEWFEVTANGATGWADRRFLLYPDGTFDVTAEIVRTLGETPTASSMLELGRIVADSVASTGEVTSRVVVVVAPTEGVVGEVTYDVLGFPDDSVYGQRLRVTGRQAQADELVRTALARAVAYELVSVESTSLCGRGGSVGELCV
jgi:hypothetical protein